MLAPPIPDDEPARLLSLQALELLDTPAEERFERITRIARRVFGTPIALVSLVDGARQWFKSAQGIDEQETPREVSFCGHAILDDRVFVVRDAYADERFASNPLVTTGPHVRFYAGYPLHSVNGHRVGTLCVLDHVERHFDDEDGRVLKDLGILVEREIAYSQLARSERALRQEMHVLARRATIDPLTRMWNREQGLSLLASEYSRAVRSKQHLAVAMIDIDNFKRINDTHGHPVGDEVLRGVSDRMRQALRPYDILSRYGGEEFLMLLVDCTLEQAQDAVERLRRNVACSGLRTSAGDLQVTVSVGLWAAIPDDHSEAGHAVMVADRALYRAKAEGRNRVSLATSDLPT
ncbi:MAG: sensor domain-containing diguanylate cyclase [Pseudomonadota bacterium]